jgi:hypothetical protein
MTQPDESREKTAKTDDVLGTPAVPEDVSDDGSDDPFARDAANEQLLGPGDEA